MVHVVTWPGCVAVAKSTFMREVSAGDDGSSFVLTDPLHNSRQKRLCENAVGQPEFRMLCAPDFWFDDGLRRKQSTHGQVDDLEGSALSDSLRCFF